MRIFGDNVFRNVGPYFKHLPSQFASLPTVSPHLPPASEVGGQSRDFRRHSIGK